MDKDMMRPKSFDRAIEKGKIPEDSEWGCRACGASNSACAEVCTRCECELEYRAGWIP